MSFPSSPSPAADARLDECEARAQRNASRWLVALALVALLLALALAGAVVYWFSIFEPLTAAWPIIVGALGFLLYALRRSIPRPADLEDWFLRRERRRLRCVEPLPRVVPTLGQREAEQRYIARQLAAAEEAYLAELYVPQEGEARVGERGPLRQYEIGRRFAHVPVARAEARQVERQPRAYPDILEAVRELRRIVLLGEPGAGKSTTLRKIELDGLRVVQEEPGKPIPLFFPLGEWTEADQSLGAFMMSGLGELGPHLQTLLQSQRATLLLDGLDQLPASQREAKGKEIQELFEEHPTLIAVLSCRAEDYTRDLGFDQLTIEPLDAGRILDFACHYLDDLEVGGGERFFWTLAGGEPVRALWQKWQALGATFDQFWEAPDQTENPNVFFHATNSEFALWYTTVRNPAGMMALARNPYMLVMLLTVYTQREPFTLPHSRGALFAQFVEGLMGWEKQRHPGNWPGEARIWAAMVRLAFAMQGRRVQEGAALERDARTAMAVREAERHLGGRRMLALLRGAQLLAPGEPVRFSHQLLQEYLAARALQQRVRARWPWQRLPATRLWPRERWWERTGWEVTVELLAELEAPDVSALLAWLADANPEVAASCLAQPGVAPLSRARREWLRERWLPRLTGGPREPDLRGRAAVGRALAVAGLDNRRGVGVGRDGVPEIAWVRVHGGRYWIGGDAKAFASLPAQEVELGEYYVARYPVTNAQWRAFLAAEDGYGDERWWKELAGGQQERAAPRWGYGNHPRETVNWYEAVAFCRWLEERLGYEVRLPTEEEWEAAARGKQARIYPWGNEYVPGYANLDETEPECEVGPYFLQQTSVVGMYPQGATPEGICDLVGNVWEWTSTTLDSDGGIVATPTVRILRSSSWHFHHVGGRVATRDWLEPLDRYGSVGFRVASSAPAVGALISDPLASAL